MFDLDIAKAKLIKALNTSTRKGSKLFPPELVKEKIDECNTREELKALSKKMIRSRNYEVSGKEAPPWDK